MEISAERGRTANLQRVAPSLASYFLQAHSIYNAVFGCTKDGPTGMGTFISHKDKVLYLVLWPISTHTHPEGAC